mmetsp:Transcript_7751/g.11449  ORF Transcript_7751/g.11449 Transcript_7751/m.11449 type:complete len:306 (+) Transcript_7751:285-1202(+)
MADGVATSPLMASDHMGGGKEAIDDSEALETELPAEQEKMDDGWVHRERVHETTCVVLSHIFVVLSIVFVSLWIQEKDVSGGGVSWETPEVFNWHPLLMVAAFGCMSLAVVAFRKPYRTQLLITRSRSNNGYTYREGDHESGLVSGVSNSKLFHASLWFATFMFGSIALRAVWRSHDNRDFGFIANLYSLHSWIGIGVVSFFLGQFFASAYLFSGFFDNLFSPSQRAFALKCHRFLGLCIYNMAAATILLGIQEKEGFIGCAYEVTESDENPASHYLDIPYSCRLSHGLGIIILAQTLCTMCTLY